MQDTLSIVILAAGRSSRMRSDTPKVLHPLAGWSVLRHVLHVAEALTPARVVLVTSPDGEAIRQEGSRCLPYLLHAIQTEPRGTGDAVRAALPALQEVDGDVLVLYGDSPLVRADTLRALLAAKAGHAMALTVMEPRDPAQYGRIVQDEAGRITGIVEYKDASEAQRAIQRCNAGVMAFDAARLPSMLARLGTGNASGEYYLTDCVALACADGDGCGHVLAEETEMLGINTRAELATAEAIIQTRLRASAMEAGVSLADPASVYFAMDTQLARDVTIEPQVWFGCGVRVEAGARIRAFSHIEGAHIGAGASVGPFARLRPGARLEADVHVGNFVEVKNAHLHEGVKAGHLSYLGDATVGAQTNIGAGTITCNYDGRHKHHTTIGADVFIGSDTALVAPVRIGDGVTIAAGSVITEDVERGLAIARSRQHVKPDWEA